MRIVVSEPYILRFDTARDFAAMPLKIARIALNMPKDPLGSGVIAIKASDLGQMLSVEGKSLYNKYMEYKKELESYCLYDDKGNLRTDENGDPVRPFKTCSYDRGLYKLDISPSASEITSEKKKYIYYESRNLAPLKTSYSIALYEQLKKAQLKDVRPVLILRKEDFSSKNKTDNLASLRATMLRAAACVEKTDFHIIEMDFSEDVIHIYAESR